MSQVEWKLLHPRMTMEHLGFIPAWLRDDNPKSAKQQLHEGYPFGGFQPFQGFRLLENNALVYPGDPPQQPLAEASLRDELIVFYPSSWVAVIQKDRSFEVARFD